MKKSLFLFFFAALGLAASAQTNCTNPHHMYKLPEGKTPVVITKLGSSPQFVPLQHVVNKDVYYKNLKALANNLKYRDEINSLFKSIGYDGVADPKFDKDKLEFTTIPFGSMGMLGDGKHKYVYSILAIKGQKDITCWRVKALTGCNLYIMNECGNAFYYANPPIERETIRFVERCTGQAKLKVKVIARYKEEMVCECNDCEGTTYKTLEIEDAVLAAEAIDNIPVVPANASYPVKKIYVDVDKATFKRLKYYDIHGKYDKHVCDSSCGSSCNDGCSEGCEHSAHSCNK